MAKALLGTMAPPRTIALLDEVRVLRARVADLEQALAAAERSLAERRADEPRATRSDERIISVAEPETVTA